MEPTTSKPFTCYALTLALCVAGCSGGSDTGATTGDPGEGGWTALVEGDWTLAPGTESYTCVRQTLNEDVYVRSFRPLAPAGTHHTVVTLEEPGAPDGTAPCQAGTNGPNMVYGSGVGTDELEFPGGVAVKLPAGMQLVLNLHLFNATSASIGGRSGIEVQRMDPGEVVHEAMILLAGKMAGLVVEPGETTQTGTCTLDAAGTVFAAFPHMHQLGSHLTATAEREGGSSLLLDQGYSFDEQRYQLIDPGVEVAAGDRIRVECGYQNPTGDTVMFGESTEDEMCFAGTYIYSARLRESYYCTE